MSSFGETIQGLHLFGVPSLMLSFGGLKQKELKAHMHAAQTILVY